eukprot:g5444.t1
MLRFVGKRRYFSTTTRERVFAMAENWIRWDSNKETRTEMKEIMQSAESDSSAYNELEDAMNKRLKFGTAGLRGQMGPGYGKMNELTVLQATDGLCTYLIDKFGEDAARERGIVIGYDHRAKGSLSSERFASLASKLAASRGFRVHAYSDLVATPLVPYGVIDRNSLAGVMITASHNPGQDNGYKVYWENGAQIIPPHDRGIAERIDHSRDNWDTRHSKLSEFGVFDDDDDDDSMNRIIEDPFPSLSKSFVHEQSSTFRNHKACSNKDANIVYTAMHGVGYPWIQKSFEAFGLPSVIPVIEQVQPDPTFPTVKFPNPEEGADSLNLAFETAKRNESSLVLANDPDADRLAVAEKDLETGEWRVFTGNEIGTLLGHYEWKKWRDLNPDADPSQVSMLASVVSSTHLGMIAKKEGFHFEQTLTGFKWMGNRAEEMLHSDRSVLFAYEEAIGFCIRPNDFVRDKDGVTAAAVFAEMYLDLRSQDLTVSQHLRNLGDHYGHCLNRSDYVLCEDPSKIDAMFERLRCDGKYWTHCGNMEITAIRDLTTGHNMGDVLDPLPTDPSSHMITYVFDHGKSQATLRTSGTEPKVKCYVEVRGDDHDSEKTLRDRCNNVFDLVFGEMLSLP